MATPNPFAAPIDRMIDRLVARQRHVEDLERYRNTLIIVEADTRDSGDWSEALGCALAAARSALDVAILTLDPCHRR